MEWVNSRLTFHQYIGHIAGLPRSGKNIWKMNFFPGRGKVREFCGWPGKFRKDLESQGKVREFENKWLWQAVSRKFINSVQEGEGCTFSWDSISLLPSSLRATLKLKKRICSLGEQILYFKSNPQIWSETVYPIKVKNKKYFIWSVRRYGKL